jgi:hypothetical protein
MLVLFRGLQLASFPLPDPMTLTLFRRLAQTGSPLAYQLALVLLGALPLASIPLARTLAFSLFRRLLVSEIAVGKWEQRGDKPLAPSTVRRIQPRLDELQARASTAP